MSVVLSRKDLRPLVEDPRWIREGLQVIAHALLDADRSGAMSWLLFPAGRPEELVNIQIESSENAGFYLRAFPDRLSADQPPPGQPALLFDQHGGLLAVMALDDLNQWRTAAPVALAVRELAPPDAATVAVLGSGAQARYQLRAVRHTLDTIRSARVYSRTPAHRERFAADLSAELGLEVIPVDSPAAAAYEADIVCVTAPATRVEAAWVRAGALVTSILPRAIDPELSALLVIPALHGPEVRSSGWNPRHGLSSPAAGRDPSEVDLTLADMIRATPPVRIDPRQTVVYEQLGVFGWDVPLMRWAYDRAVDSPGAAPFALA